jgi:hypothetical protein
MTDKKPARNRDKIGQNELGKAWVMTVTQSERPPNAICTKSAQNADSGG